MDPQAFLPNHPLRAGLEPRSQKAAEFAAAFLYGQTYDFAIKGAVRFGQSLEEVLEHKQLDIIWKSIVTQPDAPAEQGQLEPELGKAAVLVNLVSPESLTKLQQPDNSDGLEVVENAAELARRQVKSQIQTVDGSMSLQKLAKFMNSVDVCKKLRGGVESSVLTIYVVESAGEHQKDARRSPTPMRREHMEKVIRAMLCSRGDVPPDFDSDKVVYPQLDPSDV